MKALILLYFLAFQNFSFFLLFVSSIVLEAYPDASILEIEKKNYFVKTLGSTECSYHYLWPLYLHYNFVTSSM